MIDKLDLDKLDDDSLLRISYIAIHKLVVPPGYVVVPEVPTPEMFNAARDWSDKYYGKPIGNDGASGCYNAMIAARPKLGGEK